MDPEDDTGDDFDDIQDFDDTDDNQDPKPDDQQDDDDQDPQGGGGQDDDDGPQPARRPSRAQARIEALDREVREARARAEAAERRIEELARGQSRQSAEERDRQEQERLAQMDPWDRAQYQARQSEERTRGELNGLRAQIADSSDRAEFAAACASNPSLAKVKDQVEDELQRLRASGQTVPRQTLAAYLIGQQVLAKAPKARERAAKKAAANLDRERARPAGGASDAPRGREQNERAARDKRLENYTF